MNGNNFSETCDGFAGKHVKRDQVMEDEHYGTHEDRDISLNYGQELAQTVHYSGQEFLRFCVHNTNLYSVLATHHAIKVAKDNPAMVLHTLSKKMSIEYCRT